MMSRIKINLFASPGEEFSVFTYLYLSAGAPALGEIKGLINEKKNDIHEIIEKDKISPENEIEKNNSSDIRNLQIFAKF